MSRIKKTEKIIETDEQNITADESIVFSGKDDSECSSAYKAFAKMIEDYRKQNPTKYELKKESLLAKLNTL